MQKTKSLLTKCLAFLFIVCCVVAATVGLVACDDSKTVASITSKDGKLVITYSDGTTDSSISLPSSGGSTTVTAKCEHKEAIEEEYAVDGCTHKYFKFCKECGVFVGTDTKDIHTWSTDTKSFNEKSCTKASYTAKYCVVCAKAGKTVIDKDSKTITAEAKSEHEGPIKENVSFLVDENDSIVSGDNLCECLYARVKADICTACGCEVEGTRTSDYEGGHGIVGHVWGDWKFDNVPDVNQKKGVIYRTCKECGADDDKIEIAPLYKGATGENNTTVDSTTPNYTEVKSEGHSCDKEKGKTVTYKYEVEGQVLEFTHNFKDGVHYVEVDGVRKNISLETANKYIDKVFEVLEGKEVEDIPCGGEGVAANFVCAECREKYAVTVVTGNHAAHVENSADDEFTWENGVVVGCENDATYTYKCKDCKEIVTVSVTKLGHQWEGVSVTEKADGTYDIVVKCKREGCSVSSKTVDNATVAGKTTVDATCTTDGKVTYTGISVEGEVLKNNDGSDWSFDVTDEGSATGHDDGIVSGGVYKYQELKEDQIELLEGVTEATLSCSVHTKNSPASANYHCNGCGNSYPIKVWKDHTPKDGALATWKWADGDESTCSGPTCTRAADKYVDCTNSACTPATAKLEFVALGHQLVYILDSVDTTNKKIKLSSVTCVRQGCNTVLTDSDHLTLDSELEYTKYEAPKCNENGSATIKSGAKTVDIVIKATGIHKFQGTAITYTAENPGKFQTGMEPNGNITCDPSKVTAATATFKCDDCEKKYSCFVVYEHGYNKGKTETPNGTPTCTQGTSKTIYCKDCNSTIEEAPVSALGHKIKAEITVVGFVVTVKMKCENCKAEFGENGEKTETIDTESWFNLENGNVKVDNEDVTSYFSVEALTKGSCTVTGSYKVTLNDAGKAYAESKNYKFDGGLTFTVSVVAPHDFDTAGSKLTFTDKDGKDQHGHLCNGCGNFIPDSNTNSTEAAE